MSVPIYAGPGKVFFNAKGLQPEGENGPIKMELLEDTPEIAAASFGKIGQQAADQLVEITTKPFDHWGLLATLYPAYLGITVGATVGALKIGTRPHGLVNAAAKIWTVDGRIYNVVRAAVTQHPSFHLGVGVALFGDCKITGIGDGVTPVSMGSPGYLIDANAITETGGIDPPGSEMSMADFIRGKWTGTWATVAGFGLVASSLGGTTVMEAEDEWTGTVEAKYSKLTVQRRTVAYKLDSVACMIKCRPYGPSHTDIVARVGSHTHGQRLGSHDLTLTGPTGKTITQPNAEVVGAGFEFGGTKLGTGEIGFVNEMTFNAGAAQPLLAFSV